MAPDYIMTIDSEDEEDSVPIDLTDTKKHKSVQNEATLNPDFTFDLNAGDVYADVLAEHIGIQDIVQSGAVPVRITKNS